MAKKGQSKGKFAAKYRAREAAPEEEFDKRKSRVDRIDTWEEAMGGDEDQFHMNRDTVLFEDNGAKGSVDFDEISDDDEVFGLNLPSGSDSAEDDEEEDEEEEQESTSRFQRKSSKKTDEGPKGRFAKPISADSHSEPSSSDNDEGDGGDQPESDSEQEGEGEDGSDEEEEEEEDRWAAGQYHVSRRRKDESDSSDDEALDLEAEEARRLQRKFRGGLSGRDFFDEEGDEGEESEKRDARERGRWEEEEEEQARKEKDNAGMTDDEAVAFLVRNRPETLALLDDFVDASERVKVVESNLEEVRDKGRREGKEHPSLPILELEHQALITYLPTLAFYFSLLLGSPKPPSPDLMDKVLARLASLRSALATMEELDLTSGRIDEDEDEDSEEDEEGEQDGMMLASEVWDLARESEDEEEEESLDGGGQDSENDDDEEGDSEEEGMLGGLDDEELEALMDTMDPDASADDLIAAVKAYRKKKFGEEEDEDEMVVVGKKRKRVEDDTKAGPSSSRRKRRKSKKAVAGSSVPSIPTLAPLSSSSSKPNKKSTPSSSSSKATIDDDFVESTTLSQTDSSDKASKRHTLRFHVSQVHQKAQKREKGGSSRVGGDDDLPRRSKERSRREVLKRQEHGGLAAGGGAELDDIDWDEDDRNTAKGVREQKEDAGDYYDLVKKEREGAKAEKKERYEADTLAERAALLDESSGLAAGPRGVNRQILANKGLIPKRAKINRNPRVKKRVRYDKAVKKVATMKSVFKGPQTGEYQGERSGIGKRTVKSVKLGGK
ncbi:hypothetical protein T439DRAFT_329054 [Meredithblackwellia eburnea MCA 4105]